jgi:hypothetical protein
MICPPGEKKKTRLKPGSSVAPARNRGTGQRLSSFGRLLRYTDIGSLLAFLSGNYIERHTLPIGQGFESTTLDCGEMGEEIIAAVFLSNETESLGLVEPLYSTCCHILNLLK